MRADACSASAMPPTRRRVSRRPPNAVPSAAASSAAADPATVTELDTTWLEREADKRNLQRRLMAIRGTPEYHRHLAAIQAGERLAGGDPADEELSSEEELSSSEQEVSSSQYRDPDQAVAPPEAGWVYADPTLCERCSRRPSTRKCSGACERTACTGCLRWPEENDVESRSLFDSQVRCVECHSAATHGLLHKGPSQIHRQFIREQVRMRLWDPAPAAAPRPAPPMCVSHPPAEPRRTPAAPRRTLSTPPALRRSALPPLPPADPRRPRTGAEIAARLAEVRRRIEEIDAAEADRSAATADAGAVTTGAADVTPDIVDWMPEGHEGAPTGASSAPQWQCWDFGSHYQWLLGYAGDDVTNPVWSREIPDEEVPEELVPAPRWRTHSGAERSTAAAPRRGPAGAPPSPRARSRSPVAAAEEHPPEELVPRTRLSRRTLSSAELAGRETRAGRAAHAGGDAHPGRREAHAARAAHTGRGARAPLPPAEYATRVGSPSSRPHTGAEDCICLTCEFQRWVQGLEPGFRNRGPCTGEADCICLTCEFQRWVQCDRMKRRHSY